MPAAEHLGELLPHRPKFAITVQIIKVIAGIEQLLVVMLAGDVDQACSQFTGQPGRDRLIVDVDLRAPFPGQHPTDDAGGAILQRMLGHQGIHLGMIRPDGKDGLDVGLVAVIADPGGRTPPAGEQVDSLEDDGFAGAGLAGQNDQTGFLTGKIKMERIDQRQILYTKFLQHGCFVVEETGAREATFPLTPSV